MTNLRSKVSVFVELYHKRQERQALDERLAAALPNWRAT
jgi:hypothetical protein